VLPGQRKGQRALGRPCQRRRAAPHCFFCFLPKVLIKRVGLRSAGHESHDFIDSPVYYTHPVGAHISAWCVVGLACGDLDG
jgi:hypothetical protein